MVKREKIQRAIAWLPNVELGNRGGKWSMGVWVIKGKEPIGDFEIGQGGITFTKPHEKSKKGKPKGKRINWQKLADLITNS